MSMLGITLLNEITQKHEIQSSAQALDSLRVQIKQSLGQTGSFGEQQDGMDIAFCAINIESKEMSFAGAYNPCWIFRKTNKNIEIDIQEKNKICPEPENHLFVLEADRQPVGVFYKEKPFTEKKFNLEKNDVFYIFSDGFHSQFGGQKNDKYKIRRFKELIQSISKKEMKEQKILIENEFLNWKGKIEQTDDVLIVGVRI